MAVECEFQALTLAKAREEIQAYEAQSQKSLQGWGQPKVMKPLPQGFNKAHMGLDYSPPEFQQRRKED